MSLAATAASACADEYDANCTGEQTPGHRRTIRGLATRLEELSQHHRRVTASQERA
jgi:hypothetical protein